MINKINEWIKKDPNLLEYKITEFENKDYDVKIGYPQSWNIREGDIEPGDFGLC